MRIFWFAGIYTLLVGVQSCNTPYCGSSNSDEGISLYSQGITTGRDATFIAGVNANGNNGSAFVAKFNSKIKNINNGDTIVQLGKNSKVIKNEEPELIGPLFSIIFQPQYKPQHLATGYLIDTLWLIQTAVDSEIHTFGKQKLLNSLISNHLHKSFQSFTLFIFSFQSFLNKI